MYSGHVNRFHKDVYHKLKKQTKKTTGPSSKIEDKTRFSNEGMLNCF